jgi:glycosyltransferase involved in cell wall biosynthesis
MTTNNKILFVNYSLDIGGIETLVLEMCRKLDGTKYQPSVCSFQKNGTLQKEFERAGIPVHVVEKTDGIRLSFVPRLIKLFKMISPDIIHVHGNPGNWMYTAIAARLCRIPVIYTQHLIFRDRNPFWDRTGERLLSKITNRIVTVSECLADYMVKQEGVAPGKITVIRNGIDYTVFEKTVDVGKKRAELGLSDSDIVAGIIARLFPAKDHATLIDAFKIVVRKVPSAKLLIVGDGPLRNELEEKVRSLGLTANIRFLGNRRDIPELLKSFDIFVLSSILEGLPIALLEAMASRVPVVSTDVDGNGEVVTQGETGIIVPPRDPGALAAAITELLTDRAKAKQMGENGIHRIHSHFTFEKMIGEYVALYDTLVRG